MAVSGNIRCPSIGLGRFSLSVLIGLALSLNVHQHVDAFVPMGHVASSLGRRTGMAGLVHTPQVSSHRKLHATMAPDIDSVPRNETDSWPEMGSEKSKDTGDDGTKRSYFRDDYLFNEALNKLANQAGDFRQPVVRRAADCEEMWKDFCSNPQKKWQPDTVSFNIVLKAWAKTAGVLVEQHSYASTPEHLLDPNVPVFSARDCAERANQLLDEQEKEYDGIDEGDQTAAHARPDITSYNSVMDAWSKSRTPEAVEHVQALIQRMKKRKLQPDRISFTCLMEAHAYSNKDDRLEEIMKIWNLMSSNKDPKVQPNAQSLVVLLMSYSRVAAHLVTTRNADEVDQLADQAIELVRQQEERYEMTQNPYDQPDAMLYTTAMDVLAKSGSPKAAHRAENLWQKLKMLEHNPGKKSKNDRPTVYTYTTLLSAWSRVTAIVPEATQRISDLVEELWEDEYVHLNPRPFAVALRGYARSNYPLQDEPNKALVALKIVKRMRDGAKENRSLSPNLSVYNGAIDCCGKVLASHLLQTALSKDGSTLECETTALKIAFALLKTMIVDGITPTSETYAKLLLCTRNVMPTGEERTKIAESVFTKAKDAGMADKNVLRAFQQTVDSSHWQEFIVSQHLITEQGRYDWDKIPHQWQKHVR
mmetsp:Transcript_17613/g.35419  ORF Transcript_17613/g.35419 Transcript_17613/m.35419 type:complete len:646 (+) Transcript_17613:133-2070(+)